MIRKYIIVADDSIKGFDEGIAQLEREWDAEEIEPCNDCISRQYLLDNCVVDKVTMPYVPVNKIENAPPVTPQQEELIRFLKEEISKLPTNYDKVYDAATIDEGISDCIDVGRRQAYELILNMLESEK